MRKSNKGKHIDTHERRTATSGAGDRRPTPSQLGRSARQRLAIASSWAITTADGQQPLSCLCRPQGEALMYRVGTAMWHDEPRKLQIWSSVQIFSLLFSPSSSVIVALSLLS